MFEVHGGDTFLSSAPRNTQEDEEGTPMQLGGHLEFVCRDTAVMAGSSEPEGRLEVEEEEEGCRSRETSPERLEQHHSGTVSERHSSQEGEVTRCSHGKKHQKLFSFNRTHTSAEPPLDRSSRSWIGIGFQ